jgi:hypothetical protein
MNAIKRATLICSAFLRSGKKLVVASSILTIGALVPMSSAYAAGTATLSLSPASLVKNVGDTVQFDIIANIDPAGDSTNAVQANLDYPASVFDSGTAACGTSLPIQAQNSVSAGVIQLACAAATPVNGTVTVGTVNLHAAAAAAPSSPNVTYRTGAGESAVASAADSSNMLTTTTGGTYTINALTTGGTTPPSSPPPASGSTNSSSKPKAPTTGFTLLAAHPAVTLGVTTASAGLILGSARRVRQLAYKRVNK